MSADIEELTCVENGDWRKAIPFFGISIRYPGGRKALKPKTRSGCPRKSCDTRFITPGVSMLIRNIDRNRQVMWLTEANKYELSPSCCIRTIDSNKRSV